MGSCSWPYGPGLTLNLDIYNFSEDWAGTPGLYIFAYESSPKSWSALYVGQTDNFSQRIPGHEKLSEAINMGATHVHAIVINQQSDRDYYERGLIQVLQPPLNTQHR